jgi:tetratricopeptide (TPR) repeat protein
MLDWNATKSCWLSPSAIVALGISWTAICTGSAWAVPPVHEDPALARAYGSGVHAYFAHDYQRAYDDLTQAVEAGTTDPRALYFRGLAARKLGRLDEAEADFAAAADREAEGTGGWPVSRSLERVQGTDRLALERYRMRARVAMLQRDHEAMERRYSGIQRRQPDVLRMQRPEGLEIDPAPGFLDAESVIRPADDGAAADEAAERLEE